MPDGAPLVGGRGAALALGLAVALCWPMWLTGTALRFPDTDGYLKAGEAIWSYADALLLTAQTGVEPVADTVGGSVRDEAGQAATGRSLTYSAVVHAMRETGGVWVAAIVQTWVVIFVALALVTSAALAHPRMLTTGAVALGTVTPLPFHAVFIMPDLLAAVPILFGAILAWRWDDLTRGQAMLMTAFAIFAASAHYGNVPLMAGCVGGAVMLRLLTRRRLTAGLGAAALAAVAVAPLTNVGASRAALDEPSIAPLRLPILLARSIEDGPARWHLEANCPDAAPATCAILDGYVPDDVGEFLWSGDGIARISAEEMAAIRSEEARILIGAFRAHPMAQTTSILSNAARQTITIGTGNLVPADIIDATEAQDPDAARALLDRFDAVTVWGTWILSGAALVGFALARPGPGPILAVVAIAGGLIVNAGIFGGLSAPVERYQSRVIWTLPFVLMVAATHARATTVAIPSPGRRARSVTS